MLWNHSNGNRVSNKVNDEDDDDNDNAVKLDDKYDDTGDDDDDGNADDTGENDDDGENDVKLDFINDMIRGQTCSIKCCS
jgi:hypothetical protein